MAKNWAIAIGINNYYNLQPLNYAKQDAEVMRDWCQKEAGFDTVFLFTEDSPMKERLLMAGHGLIMIIYSANCGAVPGSAVLKPAVLRIATTTTTTPTPTILVFVLCVLSGGLLSP
jgi:hypothetical protein